uniref:Methyltransferase FkbM domain-containing protein n=1 Tax=Globisporangium ultimum (strain ATCC 200006 / CBS 805.95 / DAOM BR144) TaxID=431595 RepID=K3WKN1_GLOUD
MAARSAWPMTPALALVAALHVACALGGGLLNGGIDAFTPTLASHLEAAILAADASLCNRIRVPHANVRHELVHLHSFENIDEQARRLCTHRGVVEHRCALVDRELQAAAREMAALDVTEAAVNVTFDFTLSFSLSQQVDRDVGDIATSSTDKSLGLLTVFPEQALEETVANHCAVFNLTNRVCLELYVGIRNQVTDLWGCANETRESDVSEAASAEKSSDKIIEGFPSSLASLPSASPSSDEFTHSDADNVTVIQVPVHVDGQELTFVLWPTQDLDLEVALFCRKHSVPRGACEDVTHAIQATSASSTGSSTLPPEREEVCIYGNYMPTPSICGELPFPDKVFFEAYQLLLGHHFLLFLPKRVVMRDNATEPLSLEHVSVDDSEWLGAVHLEIVMPSVKLVDITLKTKIHPVLATPQTYLNAEIHTMYFDESDALYRLCILHNDDFDCMNASKLTILDTDDNGSEDHDYAVDRSLTIHAPIFNASTGSHEITVMLVNEFGNASAVSNTVTINVNLVAIAKPLPHDPTAMIDVSAFVQKRPSLCPEPLATTLHNGALAWICELWRHEWGQFSQNGEDGVLKSIFYNIGTTSKKYVEFGTEDGSQCNTRYWRENYGWSGLLMDGRYANKAINLHCEFVTAENINALFAKYNVSRQIDLLSIDVDFNDYWILDAIDRDRFAPRVIVIEYNAHIPPNEARSVKYRADAVWDGRTDFFGTSMGALYHWGVRNSYSLVYCESHGVNCFLVHNDALMGVNVSAFLHAEDVFAPPNFFGKGWSYPNASRPGDEWVWL